MTITFAEYKQLPKREIKNKNNLKEDKKYYIEGTSRRDDKMKTVYIGIYRRNRDGYNHFDEVEYVVNPFHQVGKPHGFDATSGHKFMEVIEIGPTESDYINKNRTLSELRDFDKNLRSRSRSSSRSRSRSRSRSNSSTKKGGRKHPKRKTVRRPVRRRSRK